MKKCVSEYQKQIAAFLGINIDERPFSIAAAQLTDALRPALWSDKATNQPATAKQIEYAAALGVVVSADTMTVASIRIQEKQDERNKALILQMGLKPGSKVYWKKRQIEMIVSSIADDGRLWFKGGNGYGAFPHQVEMR